MGEQGRVVIGMDPHKRSVTIEVMTADEGVVGGGRFGTDVEGFRQLLSYVAGWSERVWAIEDCRHVSGRLERFLVARGERVVRVAPKLMAGFNLIRENGCYGCHEINGYDGPNRRTGPDLRVEPNYS